MPAGPWDLPRAAAASVRSLPRKGRALEPADRNEKREQQELLNLLQHVNECSCCKVYK